MRVSSVALATWLVATLAAGLLVPAWRESQTPDEAVYVTSGLSYWRTGDFRLNVEHPPLVKLWLAIPLLFRGATWQPADADWRGASQWDVAPKVLYRNVSPGHELLVNGRMMNVLLTFGLIALAAAWAWKTWGRRAALLAAVLLAVEPNVLASGHLATTDIGFTLAVLASIFMFGLYLERRTATRLFTAATTFGLALLTRFNALLLVPVLIVLFFVSRRGKTGKLRLGEISRVVIVFAAVSFFLIWAAYGFEVRSLNAVQDRAANDLLNQWGSFGQLVQRIELPAASYVSGLLWQVAHNSGGQPAYLFGQTSQYGWWYYFPVALAIKMTLASLGLALVSLMTLRSPGHQPSSAIFTPRFLGVSLFLLTIFMMVSKLDLGVRYALPTIVLLIIFGSGVARTGWKTRKVLSVAVSLLVAFHVVSVSRFFPHWLPYANEAFGGPSKLERYLIDSNLDWGQDLPLVRQYLEHQGIVDYRFMSFTTAPAAAYGLRESPVPTDEEVSQKPFHGVVIIGKSVLHYPGRQFRWLQDIKPTVVLGNSVNVYDLR
ncbi:MAG: glycosyltransferase family 39 protein [Candidatus Kerfeldbacteria bacterium]|nr:glycosyltransferase family 39 protein [Candidatus Kerfeldbacteria bacterium]